MKSKVENGEIIEKIEQIVNWHTRLILIAEGDLVYGKSMDEELLEIEKVDKKIVEAIEAFITNALNQQRSETIKEIEGLSDKVNERGMLHWTRIRELLTKLEK